MNIDTHLPDGFTYIQDPRIILSINYASNNNFIGRPIAGYRKPVCIISSEAKDALLKVQDDLDQLNKNYVLKIFDAYRPTTAVADFGHWAQNKQDLKMQTTYYPDLEKPDLFKLGYIMSKSAHSRGSTVDLTIAIQDTTSKYKHTELDMGTIFDFFGDKSHTDSTLVSAEAQGNRQLLKSLMEKHGFKNLPQEWWHYELANEPFPDTYFDFPIS